MRQATSRILKCDPDKYAVQFFAEKLPAAAIRCYLRVPSMSMILSQDKKNRQISPNFSWKETHFRSVGKVNFHCS